MPGRGCIGIRVIRLLSKSAPEASHGFRRGIVPAQEVPEVVERLRELRIDLESAPVCGLRSLQITEPAKHQPKIEVIGSLPGIEIDRLLQGFRGERCLPAQVQGSAQQCPGFRRFRYQPQSPFQMRHRVGGPAVLNQGACQIQIEANVAGVAGDCLFVAYRRLTELSGAEQRNGEVAAVLGMRSANARSRARKATRRGRNLRRFMAESERSAIKRPGVRPPRGLFDDLFGCLNGWSRIRPGYGYRLREKGRTLRYERRPFPLLKLLLRISAGGAR